MSICIFKHIYSQLYKSSYELPHSDSTITSKTLTLPPESPKTARNDWTRKKLIVKYMELIVRHQIEGILLEFVPTDCSKTLKMSGKLIGTLSEIRTYALSNTISHRIIQRSRKIHCL